MWCLFKPSNAAVASATSKSFSQPGDPYVVALVNKPKATATATAATTTTTTTETTVRVLCSALNHRDRWMTVGMYPGIREGVCLGSDACGVALGGRLKGKRVVLDPSIAWGSSADAPRGTLEILGMPRNGTFQREVAVPDENVYEAPSHLSDAEAAALPLAGVTAYRALVTKGRVKKGDVVLVTGIGGGVAIFAVQFAVALGADVYVTSSSQAKIDRAVKTLGAKGGVLYTKDKWSKTLLEVTKGRKVDVVIDGGGGEGVAEMLRVARGGARIVTYGSTAGPSVTVTLPQLFLNNVDLLGTAMGSPEDFRGMLALVNKAKIVPVVDQEFVFEDFPAALEKMRTGKQFGKLVLVHSEGLFGGKL